MIKQTNEALAGEQSGDQSSEIWRWRPSDQSREATVIDQDSEPQELYMRLASGFRLSRAVWLAARFRLADVIGAGPASAAEIARASGTHPDSVKRLLDALTAAGLFRSEGTGSMGPRLPPTSCARITRSPSSP